jgi:hypothetical protein
MLILPLLIFIFLGLIEIGWAIRGYLVLLNANREAARYGSRPELQTTPANFAPVAFDQVLEHYEVVLNSQLNYDLTPKSGNMAVHMNYLEIFVGQPCLQVPCWDPCDSIPMADRDTSDDYMMHADFDPAYAVSYGIQHKSRIKASDLALTLLEEEFQRACRAEKRDPQAFFYQYHRVFVVESYFRQQLLLSFPILDFINPIPMYTRTIMRVNQ